MLKDTHPNKTVFFGCISDDEYGAKLDEALKKEGLTTIFAKTQEAPTGTCAVLLNGIDRSLVANLGACTKYPTQHLLQNLDVLKNSKIIYSTAFFITSNYNALHEVAKFAVENNKPFGFNLSAGFLMRINLPEVNNILTYADYIFCNEDEAAIFAEVNKIEYSSLRDVAKALAKWDKVNKERPRVAIVTCGKEPIQIAIHGQNEDQDFEYPVPLVAKEKVLDTNGAGDSFVGGFLAQIALGQSLENALRAGCYISSEVIQRSGCTFPDRNAFV